jgi:hypothetical protein
MLQRLGGKIMCEEYNGWKNRETWATALWLDNDESTYNEMVAIAKAHETQREVADAIEEYVNEMLDMENLLSTPLAIRKNLIRITTDIGSLYRVDWYEIAAQYMEKSKVTL